MRSFQWPAVDFRVNPRVISSTNTCSPVHAKTQYTVFESVAQIKRVCLSACLRDVEQIRIMQTCRAQEVSLCFLASTLPPGISSASEALLMKASEGYNSRAAIARTNCNQKICSFLHFECAYMHINEA